VNAVTKTITKLYLYFCTSLDVGLFTMSHSDVIAIKNTTMDVEQRIIIKFLVSEGMSSAEIYHRLAVVLRSETLLHVRVSKWHVMVFSADLTRQSTALVLTTKQQPNNTHKHQINKQTGPS